MKRREFLVSSALASAGLGVSHLPLPALTPAFAGLPPDPLGNAATRKILIAGGGFGEAFIRYMASLTGKARPRLCYLPTASADSPAGIITWFRSCAPLNVEAGIYFEDNTVKRVVHTRADAKVYYVSVVGGKVAERVLEPEMIS